MAATVSWDGLRELAGFRAEKGCAISVYVDLDPTVAPTAADASSRINPLIHEGELSAETAHELSHEQREALRRDLGRIRDFFEAEFDRDGSRAVVVFCAGLDNAWRTLPLADPVTDKIAVGREFYLAPLVPLVGRGDGALIAVVGRERLKVVAEQLDRRVRRLQSPRIVIVTTEETRADLEDILSHEVKAAIVGWTQAEAHASPAELLQAARPILEEWHAKQEQEAAARWGEESGRGGRATAGWPATLEAASDARIELLLFQNGTERSAYQCPKCGRVSAEGGPCPLDGTQTEERDDGLNLAVHQTLAHGGSVLALRHHQDLEPVEGIGALLRY